MTIDMFKKQRIAHNKTYLNPGMPFEDPSEFLPSFLEKVFTDNLPEKSNTIKNKRKNRTPMRNPSSNKFPLMEKVKTDVKLLKHNREIPKPKAHLTTLQSPPPSSQSSHPYSTTSTVKKTKIKKDQIKTTSSQKHEAPTFDDTSSESDNEDELQRFYEDHASKNKKERQTNTKSTKITRHRISNTASPESDSDVNEQSKQVGNKKRKITHKSKSDQSKKIKINELVDDESSSDGEDLPSLDELCGKSGQFSEQTNTHNPVSASCSSSSVVKNQLNEETLASTTTIVDLTESDEETENSNVTPKISQIPNDSKTQSDESDIILVDVVIYPPKRKPKCTKENVRSDCVNNSINKITVKTENTQNIAVSQSEHGSSVISNVENFQVLSKKVKQEPNDDCEIILDSASSSNQRLPSSEQITIRKIKSEIDSDIVNEVAKSSSVMTKQSNLNSSPSAQILSTTVKKEPQDSPMPSIASTSNSSVKNTAASMDLSLFIENYKKEIAAYQEIIETGQSVEQTFKMLEQKQAEKLNSLQSMINQFLKTNPNEGDCNSVSGMSMQELKTIANMNLVPLASIPEEDIKPNVSALQFALKQEPGTSNIPERRNSLDQNWSFGQKCMVCGKDAISACQQCGKVFFCSTECGTKYWEDGHKNACKYL